LSVHADVVPDPVVTVESSRVTPLAPAAVPDALAPPLEDVLEPERVRRFDDPVDVDVLEADVLEEAVFELLEPFDVPDEEPLRFDRDDDPASVSSDPRRDERRDRPFEESVERDDRRFDRDDDPVDELDREDREPDVPVRPDEALPVDVPPFALPALPPAFADPPSSVRHALGSGMPEVRFAT
jgi:hypothetical protein